MFDATYVINLDRCPDRWQHMQRLLAFTGLENVIRFSAIDGEALGFVGVEAAQGEGRLARDLSGFDPRCRTGEIGCVLSHAAVLADIVRQGWQRALILEDDIALAGDSESWATRCRDAFRDLPDSWELWYLYRCFDIRHRARRLTPRTLIPWTPQGGAAYAVTRAGAGRLLAALSPAATAVDRAYAELVRRREIETYAASPRLVGPGPLPSIINLGNPGKGWVENGVNRPPEYWPDTHLAHLDEAALSPPPRSAEPRPKSAHAPRRVFIVVWGFKQAGGMEYHVTQLALALASEGVDVRVFSELPVARSNAYARRLREGGVRVDSPGRLFGLADAVGRLPLGSYWGPVSAALRLVNRRDSDSNGHTLDEILADRRHHPVTQRLFDALDAATAADSRPDIVHVHGCRLGQSWALQWAAARNIPSVYTEHVTMEEWGGPLDPHAPAIVAQCAGAIACVSERSRRSLVDALHASRDVSVVRHIVDVPQHEAWSAATSEGRPLRLVSICRLAERKGIDVLLRAFAKARSEGASAELQIAGDGPDRVPLRRLARELRIPDSVFLGAIDPERVGTLLQHADVAVIPSRSEGLPVALVEAMAHARCVLATRVGGNAEVVSDGSTGVLVDADNVEQLARAIVRLSEDRASVAAMGRAARHAYERGGWSAGSAVSETLQLYADASAWRAPNRAHQVTP